MESIADRYRRLAATFAATVAAVPNDRWAEPSPCEDWTARDVVRHVVESQGMFERLVGRELEPGPSVDDDPLAAFTAVTGQVQRHLDDPGSARAEYEGQFGTSTFEDSVDGFLNFDFVVHRWDLARAAGIDDSIDDEDLAFVQGRVDVMGDNLRRPGVCGPPVDVPSDASSQERLLGLLGRRS